LDTAAADEHLGRGKESARVASWRLSGRSRIDLIGPGRQTHAADPNTKREEGSEMHTNDVSIAEMESCSTAQRG
jgi:hypothetical protein